MTVERHRGEQDVRRRLPKHRDGVFELHALQAQVDGLRLRGGELGIRLLDVGARYDTGVVPDCASASRALIGLDRLIEQRKFGIGGPHWK